MSNSLREGISILYDMELNNYLMTRSIAQLNNQIARLGQKQTFRKPSRRNNSTRVLDYFLGFLCIGGIAGAVIGVIYGLCVGDGFFSKIGKAFDGAINLALICGVIGAVAGIFVGVTRRSKAEQAIEEQYAADCKAQKRQIAGDARRVQAELRERNILIRQRDALSARKAEAAEKLDCFYSAMGIDEKYCHLIPIGYMNEFLRLGIATKLEGADGLYYLIMQELRWDQLQYTLEEISSKLDTIIDHQHALYGELVSINGKCDSMVRMAVQAAATSAKNNQLLETAVENTSIAAYNAERISQELAFQNFMLAYTHI